MKLRAGFTCDSTADWITGGREGGAALSIALSAAVIGSPRSPIPAAVEGLEGEALVEQG